ncbi:MULTISPECIES: DUF1837 domain-containing protein [Sporomusa]|nr:DUF1837 domain-containing protein [Sporomusa sp. GT1]
MREVSKMSDNSLLKSTSIPSGFDSVFIEVQHACSLNLKNPHCLRIYCLDISNNSFSHVALHKFLQKNIGRYVFSRAAIERFRLDGEEEAIGLKAIELLRNASNLKDKGAGGELGEILLYLFLEQKLNAPKLLSKVELKTSGNQYVFGSDGVHLLYDKNLAGEPYYQLVLGESKIIGSLKDAIDDAFDSIAKVNAKPDNELRLIESNILNEAFDEATIDYVKSLIIPSKRDLSINIDRAFGVFLGYTIGIDASQYSNADYRKAVVDKMANDIQTNAAHIAQKIINAKMSGYSFYFYVIPFDNASNDRAAIIKKLKGE